ncbi:MAG: bifunctional diguanylate cyclase/phosphodiesterase [Proteobacteria bacterium]|nr:bifunctional diguanylate cyclase/phosphodiesterase [Pseudomonadota bacterium]
MSPAATGDYVPGQPGYRFDPYVRLMRSLLPRANSIAMFGPAGELVWSTDTMTGPDLMNIIDDALLGAGTNPGLAGQLRLIEGNQPVYLCWLRDEDQKLMAILCVLTRAAESAERRPPDFTFVYSLLAPALECLRRDLIAQATIEELTQTVGGLDKDLHLLLSQGAAQSGAPAEGSNELQVLLQQTIEHLRACTGALLVPEKSVTLVRSGDALLPPDSAFLMRSHRRLLSLAQSQKEPVLANDTQSPENPDGFNYRVLCCALSSRAGRAIGMLVLLREPTAEPFTQRDAHIAQILARKAIAVIESSFDPLSGLYTRPEFERRVRAVIAERKSSQPWSVLYIDVDQLHAINEKSGMHVGDALLGQLGELMRKRLPPGGFGARISGDRFVLMVSAAIADAERFAEALREGAEQLPMLQADSRMPVSISIGVAPMEPTAQELAHVLAAAETACKAAKDRGRNRVEIYQPSDVSIVRRFADIGISEQLRDAIEHGRLHLYAQLILPFASAETARPHYELLLRMRDEKGQNVGPDSFLSAATRYQLMPVIDRWVVNHVIDALQPRAGVLEGRALGFCVNFSGQSLNDDSFGDMLLERVAASGLDPELLCFELTENATVANLAPAESLMRRLRDLGCGVALDDFGTGLSSLSCLRQLPVTMLKIDGSFVRDVLKDTRAESMVRAIAQLARSMSITTVAEYIETEAISRRIAELGVDYGQGFAIGRPIPLSDVLTELPLPSEATSERRALGEADAWYAAGSR